MTLSPRLRIGRALNRLGFQLTKTGKVPVCDLPLLHLAIRFLAGSRGEALRIVQIGAYDGEHADPLRAFLSTDADYRAVLVEPQAGPCGALRTLYAGDGRVTVVRAALAAADGTVTLYLPEADAAGGAAPTTASLSREFARRRSATVREEEVPAVCWTTLLARGGLEAADVLQIDAEGRDAELLRLIFGTGARPPVIHFEVANLSSADRGAVRALLAGGGYRIVETDGDCLAVTERALFAAPAAAGGRP